MKATLLGLVIVALLVALYIGLEVHQRSKPCNEYELSLMKDVPIRCFNELTKENK